MTVKAVRAVEQISDGPAAESGPPQLRAPMRLAKLLSGVEVAEKTGDGVVVIAQISYDSRQVVPGGLFVAIQGEKTDGNKFVADAVARGAVAVISELPSPPSSIAAAAVQWIRVPNARRALATAAANYFGRPADALKLVGITGTNGKTTTAYLIDSILRAAGRKTGLLGTILYRSVRKTYPATHTTPESLELQKFLAGVVQDGGTHAVLEASSHALAMDRLWGCSFAGAVFTNLTRDHLDYHKNFDDYFAAKSRLFAGTGGAAPGAAIINRDDAYGRKLADSVANVLTYGLEPGAAITTRKPSLSSSGIACTVDTPAGKIEVQSMLIGRTNVYNILAAAGAGIALDIASEAIALGIAQLTAVPGRFERIDAGQPFAVVVDYAHTDDALRNLLAAARELHPDGRVITLFGCGGDRDRTKRPLMGEAAGRMSDLVVLTSDNPRNEDPLLIINDAIVGVQRTGTKFLVEPDRERAIELAFDRALPGDIVLLAGKGHETSQYLRDRTIHSDDREIARRILGHRGFGES